MAADVQSHQACWSFVYSATDGIYRVCIQIVIAGALCTLRQMKFIVYVCIQIVIDQLIDS